MRMSDCRKLIELCRGRKVYIQTHNFPDPDAIASVYGLQKFLEYFGIESILCYDGKIDKLSSRKLTEIVEMQIFPYNQILEEMKEEDYIICVDSQKGAGNITDFIGDEVACIDHHPIFVENEYKYQDIRITGSCATLVAGYFKELDVPMDENTASALLYGLRMDTLQFSRGVTDLDIEIFAYLFKRANQEILEHLIRNNMEFDDLKAYGAAIQNIVLYGRVGFAIIPFNCPDALIGIVSDFILDLEEVEVSIIYAKREDGLKFSVRSEVSEVHAGELTERVMKHFQSNGGGHACMAGGLIRKEQEHLLGLYPDDNIREVFIKEIERTWKNQ